MWLREDINTGHMLTGRLDLGDEGSVAAAPIAEPLGG